MLAEHPAFYNKVRVFTRGVFSPRYSCERISSRRLLGPFELERQPLTAIQRLDRRFGRQDQFDVVVVELVDQADESSRLILRLRGVNMGTSLTRTA